MYALVGGPRVRYMRSNFVCVPRSTPHLCNAFIFVRSTQTNTQTHSPANRNAISLHAAVTNSISGRWQLPFSSIYVMSLRLFSHCGSCRRWLHRATCQWWLMASCCWAIFALPVGMPGEMCQRVASQPASAPARQCQCATKCDLYSYNGNKLIIFFPVRKHPFYLVRRTGKLKYGNATYFMRKYSLVSSRTHWPRCCEFIL